MSFNRTTTENGLISNRINSITHDLTGFIWIATNNGLNRFDGYEHRHYTQNPEDSFSLSGNTVLAVHCDGNNMLWALTPDYLHCYHHETDRFTRYQLSKKYESYRYENKGMISSDTSGNIWIGTPTNGLFVFEKASGAPKRILPEITAVSSLFCDQIGQVWIGGPDGRFTAYDHRKDSLRYFQIPPEIKKGIKDDYIWEIWQESESILILFTTSGFYRFNTSRLEFSPYEELNRYISNDEFELRSVLLEKDKLWIGTQGSGLIVIDLKTQKTGRYQSAPNNRNSLSNNSVTSIIKDMSGVIWVATKDGLNKYDSRQEIFTHYQHIPGDAGSLHYNFVSSFCESPEGNIWIGTFGKGISVYNRSKGSFHPIMHRSGDQQSLVHDAVRALETDASGNIWIGSMGGLQRFNHSTKRFSNFKSSNSPGALVSDDILSLLVSHDSILYVGTNGTGVSYGHINKLEKDGFATWQSGTNDLPSGRIRKMIEFSKKTIVLGTLGAGIYCLEGNHFFNLKLSDYSKHFDSDYVNALSQDKEGNLWVGTWDGLFLFDSTFNYLSQFSLATGLPSNEITGLVTDDKGDIWVSTMNGVSHISKDGLLSYKITNYTSRNGLQGSYFTTYSTLKTSDGELFFGGYNGFNRFFPDQIAINRIAPRVVFTDFLVFNQPVAVNQKISGRTILSKSIAFEQSITLNHKHRVIGFRFTAMTTSEIEKVRFACLMNNVDPDWVYLDYNQRSISYNNLSPGDYIFTVKACNADGVWDETGTSILIKVLPPFWLTGWAFLVYVCLIVLLLYFAREYSLSRERLENKALIERVQREKDAEINNLKIKFFINISHEIRTPLSLIVTPVEKLLNIDANNGQVKNQLLTVYRNARRLLALVNQLLDFRKIETGNIHLQVSEYDVCSFIRNIMNLFAESAREKNIELHLETENKKCLLWFDPDSFQKIMYNLLGNALKFTRPNGTIKVSVIYTDEKKTCTIAIRDNGIGIPADKTGQLFNRFYQVENHDLPRVDSMGTGIGLSIVKNLVELHHGEIVVESVLNEFTEFRIRFKTGKDHLENNQNITISESPLPVLFAPPPIISGPIPSIEQEPENEEIANMKRTGKEPLVLIVEDNHEIRYYLKQSLHPRYRTLEAANGEQGCTIAKQEIPDLIITDLMMPKMDGIALCKILKEDILTQHIPIVILTAKSSVEDNLEGLATGADDFVSKPFNEKILLAKVASLLTNRKKLAEKYRNDGISHELNNNNEALVTPDPFIERLIEFIKENLSDEQLSNEKIETHFKTSKMQLYRKLKACTGMSVNNFIRDIRLTEAKKLLSERELNISEVAYRVGFGDPLYFSKFFKKEVGKSPKQFRSNNRDDQ